MPKKRRMTKKQKAALKKAWKANRKKGKNKRGRG